MVCVVRHRVDSGPRRPPDAGQRVRCVVEVIQHLLQKSLLLRLAPVLDQSDEVGGQLGLAELPAGQRGELPGELVHAAVMILSLSRASATRRGRLSLW